MHGVLILGATSSIAANVARHYQKKGSHLFLVGRSADRLHTLRQELGSLVVGVATYDFADTDQTADVLQNAFDTLHNVDLVLIAHGSLGDQQLSEQSYEEVLRSTSINYLSVVSQLLVVSKFLEVQGYGHIAVISSVAGVRGRPRNYTYGAAKSALTTYLQGMRSRLYPSICVTTVLLGPVNTPMTTGHQKNILFLESEAAARCIVQAIDRKKKDVYVPGVFRAILWIVRLLPEWIFQRIPALSGP